MAHHRRQFRVHPKWPLSGPPISYEKRSNRQIPNIRIIDFHMIMFVWFKILLRPHTYYIHHWVRFYKPINEIYEISEYVLGRRSESLLCRYHTQIIYIYRLWGHCVNTHNIKRLGKPVCFIFIYISVYDYTSLASFTGSPSNNADNQKIGLLCNVFCFAKTHRFGQCRLPVNRSFAQEKSMRMLQKG